MEPIKQPARTYLFYHNGNEQNKIHNNKSAQINKINKSARRIQIISETFLVNKL